MGRWTVYIHWYSHPPLPPHARDRTRLPSTFCLTPWLIISNRFPTLDRFSSLLPTLPFVCLSITLPRHSFLTFHLQISVMREMHIPSLRLLDRKSTRLNSSHVE